MFAWIYSINLNDINLVLSKSFKFCCQRIVIAKIQNAWQFLLTKLFLFHSPKTFKMALNKLSCLLQIFASGSQLIVKRPFDTVQQKTNKENSYKAIEFWLLAKCNVKMSNSSYNIKGKFEDAEQLYFNIIQLFYLVKQLLLLTKKKEV